MILGKVDLTEQIDMEFSLEVFGTSEQTQSVRFVIEGEEYDISCKCKVENGSISATIPKLKGILPAGVYESRLEVMVGDRLFVPLREQIELNPLIEFDVKTKRVEPVKEGVKVTIKKQTFSEDSKIKEVTGIDKNIQKAISEGYEVSKVGENYIMKRGNTYVGVISEKATLKSSKGYSTMTDLINGLEEEYGA